MFLNHPPLDGAGVHHNPDTGTEGLWWEVVLERSANETRVACLYINHRSLCIAQRIVRTVSSADLAPDDADGVRLAAANAVYVGDTLSEVPLRVLCAFDALELEQADVGVRVALATLVANVAALDID